MPLYPYQGPVVGIGGTPVDPSSPGGSNIAPSELTFDSVESVKIPFVFNEASPKTITTLAALEGVQEAEIVVEQPFDDAAATLVLELANAGVILAASENDPATVAGYKSEEYKEASAVDTLQIIINPAASTQGSGFVRAEIRRNSP